MMATHREAETEGIQEKVPEAKLDLDRMDCQVQNLFINFYDQMDFTLDQHLAITKAVIELNIH